MASERPGIGPGIDRSKSIEDLHHLRLMALLLRKLVSSTISTPFPMG